MDFDTVSELFGRRAPGAFVERMDSWRGDDSIRCNYCDRRATVTAEYGNHLHNVSDSAQACAEHVGDLATAAGRADAEWAGVSLLT